MGWTMAMQRLVEQAHPCFPITIYYAFKQSETKGEIGTVSTGWETFLGAVIRCGFAINGTWPLRTELGNRLRGRGSNTLASSVVLVCRQRPTDAPLATRRGIYHCAKDRVACGVMRFATRQHRPRRPRPGRHRPWHGYLHPLRQGVGHIRPAVARTGSPWH